MRRRHLIAGVCVIVALSSAWAIDEFVWKKSRIVFDQDVLLEPNHPVHIKVIEVSRSGFFDLPHVGALVGGSVKFKLFVDSADGAASHVWMETRPLSIWRVGTNVYILGNYSVEWQLFRLQGDVLTRIKLSELPAEPIPWNLVAAQDVDSWKKSFEHDRLLIPR